MTYMIKHGRFTLEVTDKDRPEAIGVNFDMLDGGMNANISKAAKIAAKDRLPIGKFPTMDEAALDLKWVLDNAGSLISGAVIDLSGGNIP